MTNPRINQRYVIRGMESLERIFMDYGDLAPAEDDSVVSVRVYRARKHPTHAFTVKDHKPISISALPLTRLCQTTAHVRPQRIQHPDGYLFLEEHFPMLSYFDRCEILSNRENTTLADRQWTIKEYQRVASLLSPPPPDAASEKARALNLELPRRPVAADLDSRKEAPSAAMSIAPYIALGVVVALIGAVRIFRGVGAGRGLLPTFVDPKDQ